MWIRSVNHECGELAERTETAAALFGFEVHILIAL